ncbi:MULTISPECIES: hypothetical protein [Flavobacterium]|uniref:Lipoprotein n=1 Tax=Flavobacterium hankyongi TaxID=1176532 RepID=A0ABP9AB81_9FLAO|nr:hypothetical protein [Flavobacterium sp. N1846]
MVKLSFIFFSFLLSLNGCNEKKSFNNSANVNQDSYLEYKKEFDSTLVSHFPNKIEYVESFKILNTNQEKNDVSLFLIEYKVPKDSIKLLEKKFSKDLKYKYDSREKCLLIVNRFETKRTKDSLEIVTVEDISKVNDPCYKNLLPVPNFIDFSIQRNTDFWKDENFVIYVLDAKSGNHFEKFNLEPNPQMPDDWKNGYSKGIAIDKQKGTVIYWSVIW